MVAGNEVDVKRQKLADGVIIYVIGIILVLVSTTEICVAVIRPVILRDCVFDRAGFV